MAWLFGCDDKTAYDYIDADEAGRLDRALEAAGLDRAALSEDEPPLEVLVRDGRVRRIAFHSAPTLTTLAWVAELEGLEALDLVDAQLPALDGLTGPCRLTQLRLMRTQTTSLAALGACPTLERLTVVDVPMNSLASLPPLPALEELVVDRTPLRDTGGLTGRGSLTTLRLTNTELASLAGIDTLAALTSLNVSHNRLTTLQGLGPSLSALRELNVSHNQLTDASALDALPALADPDLTHNQLTAFPAVALRAPQPRITDNPGAEAFFAERRVATQRAEAQALAAEIPTAHAPELPAARLTTRESRRSTRWSGNDVTGNGSIERLEGAGWIALSEHDRLDFSRTGRNANPVRLQLTVRSGTARVYFDRTSSGYPYVDVRPGAPVTARGALRRGETLVGFFVAARGGPVEGLRYQVEPAR